MTTSSEAAIAILQEFDGICQSNDIRYSLLESSLLMAETGGTFRGYETDVVMSYAEFLRFREAVNESEASNRTIEGLDENPTMPGWYFRYVDTATTMFDFDYAHCRKAHGIGVSIHIARTYGPKNESPVTRAKRTYLRSFERGMNAQIIPDYQNEDAPKGSSSAIKRRVDLVRQKLGDESFSQKYSRRFQMTAAKDLKKATYVLHPECGVIGLPAGFLRSVERVTLNGCRVNASKKRKSYLTSRYGKDLSTVSPWVRKETFMTCFSETVSYERFVETIDDVLKDESFWRHREIWNKELNTSILPQQTAQEQRWVPFYMLGDRYRDWKRFVPQKSRIKELFNEGRHGLLWLMLDPYVQHIEEYRKQGFAFVIDDDIWDMCLELYRENGLDDVADELAELRREKPLPAIDGREAQAYLEKAATHPRTMPDPVFKVVSCEGVPTE